MHYLDNTLVFSPSDLIIFVASPFASWMERLTLEQPDHGIESDGHDPLLQTLANRGMQHERAYLDQLNVQGLGMVVIDNSAPQAAESATRDAMQAGADVIYQARLGRLETDHRFIGIADFLRKRPGPSSLGDYHYEPWDTKLARKAKPYFVIQLCCYADLLQPLQGRLADHIHIVLGAATTEGHPDVRSLRTQDYYYYYLALKRAFLDFHRTFDAEQVPDPSLSTEHGRWSAYAQQRLETCDHSRIANISKTQIKRLQAAGIDTVAALAATDLERISKLADETFARLQQQAQLQTQSRGQERPFYEVLPHPEGVAQGLALLPPASPGDVYFDLEGFSLIEGGLEYLWGVCCQASEPAETPAAAPQYLDWWAHDPQQERLAFEAFIDWAYSRWQADPTMHIYHYGHYEITALQWLMGRFGTREAEVDNLLRHGVLVDLYAVVRNGLRIGEPSYSIKNIEQLYREARTTDVVAGSDSVVYYESWIEQPDGVDWQASALLHAIREYNRDDCFSTAELTAWLQQVQAETGIAYVARESKETTLSEEAETASRLSQDLLQAAALDGCAIKSLLAHLVDFHRRERKPARWRYFERLGMSEAELYDDSDCLAGLVRTETPPESVKKSLLYEYRFDAAQETKLLPGRHLRADQPDETVTLEQVDRRRGLAYVKVGQKHDLPNRLNLIPDEHISTKILAEGVYGLVERYWEDGVEQGAIFDIIERRPPRLRDHPGGPILQGPDGLGGAIAAVQGLDRSTLCIQGPPGTGKTYTGARLIKALIDSGRRVGIASNSYKAISHLLGKVAELLLEDAGVGRVIRVTTDGDDPVLKLSNVEQISSASKLVLTDDVVLIGGTAWTFAHAGLVDQLDTLFVDEAGQVALANLVAMSRSARNLVLLGDQMQLGQPVQGSHPGDSGCSSLEYVLKGEVVIPPERGIFLGTSWRMHPRICEFISAMVYDDQLQAEPSTAWRVVKVPDGADRLCVEAGLYFVPVVHEGNSRSSEEEAEMIKTLARELLGREKTDTSGTVIGAIEWKDMLFVAPYNVQVHLLQHALGEQAKVGTVDRFQGQEAPIVFVSMCASTVDDSTRGIDFLFNKNRLNVAISRAQSLAFVVGNPALARTEVKTLEQMTQVNLFARLSELHAFCPRLCDTEN
jgi:uncharacterized protein